MATIQKKSFWQQYGSLILILGGIIIGALMALVPGIAFTNAMRDIMAGDMVAGISKGAEALLIGAAIALGTALGLGVTGLIGGGGAL